MRKNILVVEDEHKINALIKTSLQTVGYKCFQAFSGLEAIAMLNREKVDLIILDVQLPDIDGFTLIQRTKDVPVIYLTARDSIEDRVKGLTLGAEDYIVKPFALDELIARIQVVLRRFDSQEQRLYIGDLVIDIPKRVVMKGNAIIELSPQEFNLLEVLIINKNIALTREQLLQQAWGFDYFGDDRTVDVHVRRLRQKLSLEKYLVTVFKIGYRLEV